MFSFTRENTSLLAKWWRNVDKQILSSFVFLFLLGLFFSFSSTSSVIAEKMNKETYFFFIKHLIFVIISLFFLIVISIQNRNRLIKFLPYLFFISIFLLFLVLLFGVEVKGSKRWLDLPFLPRFQPTEILKPLFIIYISKIIMLNDKVNIFNRYIFSFLILLLVATLLVSQPDLGQTLLLILTWITMIFVSGFNMFLLIFLGIIFLIVITFIIFFFPDKFGYIFIRIK
jgi:cell division protein FtsW